MFQHSRQAEGGSHPELAVQSRSPQGPSRSGRGGVYTIEGNQHSQDQVCWQGWRVEEGQWKKIGKAHKMSLKSNVMKFERQKEIVLCK